MSLRAGSNFNKCKSCGEDIVFFSYIELYRQYNKDLCANCFEKTLDEFLTINKDKFDEFVTTYTITEKLIND